MAEFMNADGSALVGALQPGGVGQALQVDAQGNLKTTSGSGASLDGASGAGMTPEALLPVQQWRSWQHQL